MAIPYREHHALDYEPERGNKSAKAERLVDYCLGDFSHRPVVPCTRNRSYLLGSRILLLEADARRLVVSGRAGRTKETKKVAKALVSQHAAVPPGLTSWVTRGDDAGRATDPEQGLHVTAMRSASRRDLVLVPSADRERYLGSNLARQMEELRDSWVSWEEKSDSAWWGGALTGDSPSFQEPVTVTRREILCHFRDHPSDQVSLQLVEVPKGTEMPAGVELQEKFAKRAAYSHKCLLLLPGNDIASGSSWYFAGNSVVLMPRPHLEHILYFEMEPWEHYVPLERHPADILVKVQWVLDNPEEAQRIVARSHERLRWLAGPEYQWACNEVLRRIANPGA